MKNLVKYLLVVVCLIPEIQVEGQDSEGQQGRISNTEPAADCAVSPDLVETIAGSMGWDVEEIEFLPWMRPLSAEQAMTAEVEKERLIFPKEGNPWLSCVEENHLLWSVLPEDFDHLFARRVLEVTEKTDRVIFRTREAGLGEVTAGIWSDDEDSLIEELKTYLPTELPGGMTRAHFDTETAGDGTGTVLAYVAYYRGTEKGIVLPVLPVSAEGTKEFRSDYENQEAENNNMQQESHGGCTAYVKRDDMMNVLSVLLDGVVVQLISDKHDIEELYTRSIRSIPKHSKHLQPKPMDRKNYTDLFRRSRRVFTV